MFEIEMKPASEDFSVCWLAAARHINAHGEGRVNWLKANVSPPFLEHLSFRLGNQLFFVRIEDESGRLPTPGNIHGLFQIAAGCNGHACLMPMSRRPDGWFAGYPGWGLIDAETRTPIDPVAPVSDERIEMTDWELQEFAVQVVRNGLQNEGRELMSAQGNPSVDPAIWVIGPEGPEWVIVRAVRYPAHTAQIPPIWTDLACRTEGYAAVGNFASVAIASSEQKMTPDAPVSPLWRGHGLIVQYAGLQRLT